MKIKNLNKLIDTDIKLKIANGVFWSFLGTFISRGLFFLTTIFITDVVSLEEYGEIGIIKSIIVTFTMFSLASFGVTATRYIAIYKEKDLSRVGKILSLTLLSTVLVSLIIFIGINAFSTYFSRHVINKEGFTLGTFLISIAILFSAINGYQNGALAGFEKFKNISIINIINGVLSIPILFVLTKYYGVLGYCFGMALLFLILFICSQIYLQRAVKEVDIKLNIFNIKSEFKIIKKFSIPSFLGGFIISPTILVCNNILVKSNNGFVAMGIYEAAFNFSIIAMTFNSMVGQVLYPFAVRLFNKKNKKFDFLNLNMPWLIGVFLSLFLIFLPDFFTYIFDEKYHNIEMYKTVIYIAIFIIFISHRQGISRNLAAVNKMWYGFFDNLIWAFLAIVFTFYFVDKGAQGRALAFVLAYFINSIFILPFYIKKEIIQKNFIYSIQSISIWSLVLVSFWITTLNLDLYLRLLLLILSLIFLCFISVNWFLKSKN